MHVRVFCDSYVGGNSISKCVVWEKDAILQDSMFVLPNYFAFLVCLTSMCMPDYAFRVLLDAWSRRKVGERQTNILFSLPPAAHFYVVRKPSD